MTTSHKPHSVDLGALSAMQQAVQASWDETNRRSDLYEHHRKRWEREVLPTPTKAMHEELLDHLAANGYSVVRVSPDTPFRPVDDAKPLTDPCASLPHDHSGFAEHGCPACDCYESEAINATRLDTAEDVCGTVKAYLTAITDPEARASIAMALTAWERAAP